MQSYNIISEPVIEPPSEHGEDEVPLFLRSPEKTEAPWAVAVAYC
jgi:hypothetical protein